MHPFEYVHAWKPFFKIRFRDIITNSYICKEPI